MTGLIILIVVVLFVLGVVKTFSYPVQNGKRYKEFKESGLPRGVVRTPDERFKNLPGFDFEPHYVEIGGLRVHYLDEGPPDANPVLLMHGEPSWCYLYRKMIPPIVEAGHRAIAPDLIGFGRSDKLEDRRDYSYQLQVDMVTAFIKELDLTNITMFCQDWGGLIGLRVAAENEERFARVIAANTALPGQPREDIKPREVMTPTTLIGFPLWLAFSQMMPVFKAGFILQFGTVSKLPPEVVAAYDAPFPDKRYKAGARVYPTLVGSAVKENTEAWKVWCKWEKPFLTAFSDKDPVLGGGDKIFHKVIPGAKDQPHVTTKDGGHFLQEDKGEELGALVVDFIERTK